MSHLARRVLSQNLPPSHVLARDTSEELLFAELCAQAERAAGLTLDAIVAVSIRSPLALIRTLIQLDGLSAGLLLLSPALPRTAIDGIMQLAKARYLVSDRQEFDDAIAPEAVPQAFDRQRGKNALQTMWFMTTSGTMGVPNVAAHTLNGLSRSIRPPRQGTAPVWGLLYEPSRFAGMQVVLQSMLGGGTLLAQDTGAPLADRVGFLLRHGCTHLSATPTLWRKLLMLPAAEALPLRQITLGGEIADQTLLGALASRYPDARRTHIYASTEAGVGFSVNDGIAGFPLDFLDQSSGQTPLKIVDGMLWAKPPDFVAHQINLRSLVRDKDGYIRTGDRVEIRGDRVRFLGRDGAVANIGGAKVQIEDVERVINAHPDVAECLVEQKPSSIVGNMLVLKVVPKDASADAAAFRRVVKSWCASNLPRQANPAAITVVESLPASLAGKLSRVS